MIRVSMLFPRLEDDVSAGQAQAFDHAYHRNHHAPLVREAFGPHGMVDFDIDRGVAGSPDQPPPFVAAGHAIFHSMDSFRAAFAAAGPRVLEDVANFSKVPPLIQISEIVG